MAIGAIPSLGAAGAGPAALGPVGRVANPAATAVPGADAVSGPSFGSQLADALDTVAGSHTAADRLAVDAATGDLTAVHDYTIAAAEAQLLTQLTVEVRNRAIEAFNDIMHMQV